MKCSKDAQKSTTGDAYRPYARAAALGININEKGGLK